MQQRLCRASSWRRGWVPLFLYVSRDTSQAESCSSMGTCRCLGRRWPCSPQLSVTLLLDPDGHLKSAEGTLHSHSLLMGDPVFRAQSFYSFGITGAVIPLALRGTVWEEWWSSWHPRHAFWYPFSTWYWLRLRRGSESWSLFLVPWQYWALNLGLHTCWTSVLPLSYTTSCLPPF